MLRENKSVFSSPLQSRASELRKCTHVPSYNSTTKLIKNKARPSPVKSAKNAFPAAQNSLFPVLAPDNPLPLFNSFTSKSLHTIRTSKNSRKSYSSCRGFDTHYFFTAHPKTSCNALVISSKSDTTRVPVYTACGSLVTSFP